MIRGIALFLGLSLLGTAISACRDADRGSEARDLQVLAVRSVAIRRGSVERSIKITGTVESIQAIDVVAQATGTITSLKVEEGDRVKSGALLCLIDNPMVHLAQERTELELAQLRVELESTRRLNDKGYVARRAREDLEFRIQRAELETRRTREDVRRLRVIAPFRAVLASRLVTAGQQVVPGRPLFRLVDEDHLQVVLSVPEAELAGLRTKLKARLRSVATQQEASGQVTRISPVVDAFTGTVRVTVAIEPESALRPGMLVSVSIVTLRRDAVLVIPRRAIDLDADPPAVFRVDRTPGEDGGARRMVHRVVPVLGVRGRDTMEVMGGLALGDRVVVAGQASLRDGVVVREARAAPGYQETRPAAPVDEDAGAAQPDHRTGVTR